MWVQGFASSERPICFWLLFAPFHVLFNPAGWNWREMHVPEICTRTKLWWDSVCGLSFLPAVTWGDHSHWSVVSYVEAIDSQPQSSTQAGVGPGSAGFLRRRTPGRWECCMASCLFREALTLTSAGVWKINFLHCFNVDITCAAFYT